MLRISNSVFKAAAIVTAAMLVLSACGGGGGGGGGVAPAYHNVTISWVANHEKGVNMAGGGYKVSISGQTTAIDVPFNVASGVTPTSTIKSLYTGSYTATVKAYAALDSSGGTTGSTSAASSSISIVVP
ncbi:MAG: hypothetical protein ACOH1I_10770 [Gallionellaceae bacterium]|jgi:hypothetical protein